MQIFLNGLWAMEYEKLSEKEKTAVSDRMQEDYGTALVIVGGMMQSSVFKVNVGDDQIGFAGYEKVDDLIRGVYENIRCNKWCDSKASDPDRKLLEIEKVLYRR